MQWNSLESYFLSNFDLDDDLTANNPDETPGREKKLANAFKKPLASRMPCSASP